MITLARSSLADAGGDWCAICLDYGKRNHPLQEVRSGYPGPYGFPFSAVRAHERCLAEFPAVQLVSEVIMTYLRAATRMSIQQLDKAAKEFHDKGFYSLSAALKDMLGHKSPREHQSVTESQVVERRIASLAGVRDQPRHSPIPITREAFGRQSMGSLLQVANWYANFGELKKAGEVLQHVEDRRRSIEPTEREKIEASYRMRVAQIRRSDKAARDAIKSAEHNPYMTKTAYVLAGNILVSDNPSRARTFFEFILAQGSASSWLYRAESFFGIASMILQERKSPELAYQLLAAAQYIYGTLGLQGTPHPAFHDHLRAENLTPADVIRYDTQIETISKSSRLGLRQNAVRDSGLQAEILSDLLLLIPAKQRGPVDLIPYRKPPRVVVLGPDKPERNMRLLRRIAKYVAHSGYEATIVKDELDLPEETIQEKVQRLVSRSRFVIVEHSQPSGHIGEVEWLRGSGIIIAILHRVGAQATSVQADYGSRFAAVLRFFPYTARGLETKVADACVWAEQQIDRKRAEFLSLYPRGTPRSII